MITEGVPQIFAITGRFQSFKRETVILLLETLGHTYKPFVGDKTTVLVVGYFTVDLFDESKESKKLIMARKANILMISEMAFIKWLIKNFKEFTHDQQQSYLTMHEQLLREQIPKLAEFKGIELMEQLILLLERKLTII